MKLKSKMIVSMCMVFVLFILASAVGLVSMRESQTRFETFLDRDVALLQLKNDIYAQGLQMGQAIRNVILEPANKTGHKNYEMASRDFDSALDKAIELSAHDPAAQQVLKEIAALRKDQKPIQENIISVAITDPTKATAMTNAQETPLWRSIKAKLLDLIQKQTAALQNTRAQTLSHTWERISLSTGLVVAALLFGIILSAWLVRSITRPLEYAVKIAKTAAAGDLSTHIEVTSRDETGELLQAMQEMNNNLRKTVTEVRNSTLLIAHAAGEIAEGNHDLATRTEAQGSSLESTTQSMHELTETVQQNAEYASQANTLAGTASSVAVRGGAVVTEVVQTMGEISQASQQIFDIISLIDGIAFQTNILALNAAVEAARAGEQGRGFAVVASEVRMLAQRSADAAREIKGLINNSVDKVNAGSKLVEQAGQTMTEIVSSIQRVNDIMTDITQATTQQTAGIRQVNDAIHQIDAATQQNSALVQQVSTVATSLQERGQELTDLVSRFTLESEVAAAA